MVPQRPRRGRVSVGIILLSAVSLLGVAGRGAPGVDALFGDSALLDDSNFDADILAPPDSMTLTTPVPGTANLGWSASTSAYATATKVMRGTVTGGPYTVIATLAPTVFSYTDTPGLGSFFYVTRSTFQSWESLDSNEVNTVFISLNTPWFNCAAQAADTGGDNNGYQTNPASGCGDDGVPAEDPMSGTTNKTSCSNNGKDKHRFSNFSISIVAATAIRGIEVRTQSWMNATGGTNRLCVRLSSNGGSSWTSYLQLNLAAIGETNLTFGSTSNLWGRTWTVANFSNANFVVQITDVTSAFGTKTFFLDNVQVRVTYS